ncbi:hypothetical protein CAPTEDRAFT_168114 [Capitella teleta]|uniref:BZIP domain-containing protein n=1 Tax=Capitella teleta TaxID=283909 RepID=R7TK17_CAPTE|nr:hypothetical protein CAPTEDRAFT_168114 [Capitella teleta]|eukprot:ELT91871.1 hypothetical protein CAPTEDRAFT_168114 [Capitella teleta]
MESHKTLTLTPWASTRSLRWNQSLCGLFDTGPTDAAASSLERLPSVEFPSDLAAVNTLDEMFAALEKETMATGGDAPTNARLPSDTSDLLSLDGDFNFMQNTEYCEVFTDIDQLLMDAQPSTSTAEGVNPLKRTATILTNEHTPSDHDYTVKKICTEADVAEATPASKDEKYVVRRTKNNIASQRSRAKRKQKNNELSIQAANLEMRNAELRKKVEEMEKMAKELKDALVRTLAQK